MSAQVANLGLYGFQRIASGDGVVSGNFAAVVAIGDDASFGAGTTVSKGDAPTSGDVVTKEAVRLAPFTAVEIATGVV